MATAIILKNWTKNKDNGEPYKKQPIHPAIKFEKLLKRQKIAFTKTIMKYFDIEPLEIKTTCHGSWQRKPTGLFSHYVLPGTECFKFDY